MSDEKGVCPACNEIGPVYAVCGSCGEDVVAPFSAEEQALQEMFNQAPQPVVGEGRRRATDVVEHVDQDEARYNAKYGLDKNGDPLPVDEILGDRTDGEGYHFALEEGFDSFSNDDDEAANIDAVNKFFEPNGFNH